jgi:hypothetical protein
MFTVADISKDAKRFLANCDDETLLNRLNYVVELLANESDWDPLIGVVDICTNPDARCVTLPREVETPLQINIGGTPSIARNRFFSFHLNGPGDDCRDSCGFSWDDKGDYATVQDPTQPVQLIAFLEQAADTNSAIWVYGYDESNRWIRTEINGQTVDGFPVPTAFGYAMPNPDAPKVSRIVRVRKDVTEGYVRLTSYDIGSTTGVLIGDYAPDETEPSYRRIQLSRNCGWVRIIYRKRISKLRTLNDLIPLHSPFAILMALKALDKFENDQLEEADAYLRRAIEFLTKEQLSRNPVAHIPVQVTGPKLVAAGDRLE